MIAATSQYAAWLPDSIDGRDRRSENQGRTDDKQSGEHYVRVGVSYALEDGVMLEQSVETVDIDIDREDEQQECKS